MNPKQKPTRTLRMQPKTVRIALWLISILLVFPVLVMALSPVLMWLGKFLLIGIVVMALFGLYILALLGNLLGVI